MTLTLLAPLSGILVPLENVPDPAFAQRLVGDGISIDPLSDRVLAPCDARVLQVHRAHHAVTLLAQGLEIIIHVGLDTVMLGGEGFTALVRADDMVRAGDPLLSFDADLVARRARSLLTEVVVSNVDRIASIERSAGRVTAGAMWSCASSSRETGAPDSRCHRATPIARHPIVVIAQGGLHARPAATDYRGRAALLLRRAA